MAKGKLVLVGAGPGDPELITLKGIKALEQAEVVLYDALANEELLAYAKNAEKIFVGKKPGVHKAQQIEINQMLVELTLAGKHVVRLKGGDAYVFGRGHEEQMSVAEHGIPVEIIPGVSSFYAVPELKSLPLTRRGYSESFWVLTGTTKDLDLAYDIKRAADSNATVVILMGMKKLPEIVSIFQEKRKGDLPVAIIQNGSMPDEKVGLGTIDSIIDVVAQKKLSSPAIIVIGEVVKTITV